MLVTNKTKLLGAIIAGGKSRRFGSDKAFADIGGAPMMAHVYSALVPQVDSIVACGREWPGVASIPDRPFDGAGPLGGLNAALHCANDRGFDGVLTVPLDVMPVPGNLTALLVRGGPTVFERQHLIGWWPASFANILDGHLKAGHRSFRGWMEVTKAILIPEPTPLININYPTDLALLI